MASYKPGQSGNLKGRPIKELTLSNVVERKLADEMTMEEYEQSVSAVQYFADELIRNAIKLAKTDPKQFREYMEFIRDTTEGKPSQSVKLSGDSENPVALVISKAQSDEQH